MTAPRSLSKEVTSGFTSIEKLNATNWWAWRMIIENLFEIYDYLKYIDGSFPIPVPASPSAPTAAESIAIKEWTTEDKHAKHLLMSSIGPAKLVYLRGTKTAQGAWNQLVAIHEPKGTTAVLDIVWKLYSARCPEGYSVTEHITTLRGYLEDINTRGSNIPDGHFAMICAKSLPRSWDQWMSSFLAVQPDLDKLISANVIHRIMEEDQRRKSRDDVDEVANLAAHNRGKRPIPTTGLICGNPNCKHKEGHSTAQCYAKGGGSEGKGPRQIAAKKKKD
jgi:hypothetical protein